MGISVAQLRALSTEKLTTSADTAVAVGKDVETRAGEIVDAAKSAAGAGFWAGADAQAQNDLLGTFPAPLEAASSVFKAAATTLDTLVAELEGAKSDIETAIASYPEHKVQDDGTVTWPPSPDAATEARLRQQAEELFNLLLKAIDRANAADESAVTQLAQKDLGAGPVPVKLPDGSVYLATGDKDNVVKVSNDKDGNLIANVDGKDFRFDPGTRLTVDGQAGDDKIDIDKNVKEDVAVFGGKDDDTIHGSDKANVLNGGDGADVIHGGGGNDRIDAGGNSSGYDVVYGNDGDDTITGGSGNDRVAGGAGNDTIDGGQGKDYLDGQRDDDTITGGTEDDVIYGLEGEDVLRGEDGNDYLEGGRDNDRIDGGIGNDTISGGHGEDTLSGGDGRDVLYGGHGKDTVDGGSGLDQAYVQEEDAITKDRYGIDTAERNNVTISDNAGVYQVEGSDDFKARVQADLDMMAASPTAQQMLDKQAAEFGGFDDFVQPGEDTLKIEELSFDPNNPHRDLENGYASSSRDGHDNSHNVIEYNAAKSLDDPGSAPSNVLYHEMAHTYDFRHDQFDEDLHTDTRSPDTDYSGDGVPNGERTAVGLPIDHDDNPQTDLKLQEDHPWALTENGLRTEQGRPWRLTYGLPIPPR
ncbi:M91 family zinc metallopeptidase [Stackebrandtia nassauensis]|uniref:Hemolysin-type calcium-binding region n=1 Tax=Stackebrandtia nassauensis (strain DSM 44728 / CIP 108903 / NRRL B-16338 / NBRC 102104 / LLR-40K-21) TaxID=446470 RepID=D3Q6I3_STANL|nr:M91 family zinc metallopeptidase [Stackebrandtia nassauensis]ADD44226.1 Hemolysin-type calcium-binding region [Stackebrandtia nassauensis DSM 44728]